MKQKWAKEWAGCLSETQMLKERKKRQTSRNISNAGGVKVLPHVTPKTKEDALMKLMKLMNAKDRYSSPEW